MFQSNLLQGHQVLGQFTATFIHGSVGPLQRDRERVRQVRRTGGKRQVGRQVRDRPVGTTGETVWPAHTHTHTHTLRRLTSPSLSSLMYVSSFPKPISDWRQRDRWRVRHRDRKTRETGRGEAGRYQRHSTQPSADWLVEQSRTNQVKLLQITLRKTNVGR